MDVKQDQKVGKAVITSSDIVANEKGLAALKEKDAFHSIT